MSTATWTSADILTADEYEARATAALARVGFAADEAAELVAGRWPMDARGVRFEVRARGLALDADDLTDFLRDRFKRTHTEDGAPLVADSIGWPARIVEALIGWAVVNRRGEPCEPVEVRPPAVGPTPGVVTVEALLGALRSESMVERCAAALTLARSLGVGLALAGETREDAEWLIGPQLCDLLGRAMAGDASAVDELVPLVTGDPADAFEGRA